MKIKIVLFAVLFLFAVTAKSQKSPKKINARAESGYVGKILFKDGTEWSGKFTYNAVAFEGVLIVKVEGKIQTLSPYVVKSFSFFDSTLAIKRNFYSLKVNSPTNINQAFNFFELIYEGQSLSILGRNEAKKKINMTLYAASNGLIRKKQVYKDFNKYILNHKDDNLYPFSRKQFLDLIEDDGTTLNYMRARHYKLHESDLDQYFELIDLHDKSTRQNTE